MMTTALMLAVAAETRAAHTIASPLLFSGNQEACYVRNVGPTPIAVTVQIAQMDGTAVTPTFEDCNAAPIAAGGSCVALASPPALYVACSVTTPGSAKSLRATFESRYGTANNVNIAEELW